MYPASSDSFGCRVQQIENDDGGKGFSRTGGSLPAATSSGHGMLGAIKVATSNLPGHMAWNHPFNGVEL
jgi:hypothetical protein